jgi:hypothetical protein
MFFGGDVTNATCIHGNDDKRKKADDGTRSGRIFTAEIFRTRDHANAGRCRYRFHGAINGGFIFATSELVSGFGGKQAREITICYAELSRL